MYHSNMTCGEKTHPHINMKGQYEFWRNPSYRHYIEKNGYHFNPHTLDIALSKMVNVDGTRGGHWTRDEVVSAMEKDKMIIPDGYTPCDATYLANMFYSDYMGGSMKSETDALMMAHEFMNDPDGYPERAFADWLNKIMFKGCPIEWQKMI